MTDAVNPSNCLARFLIPFLSDRFLYRPGAALVEAAQTASLYDPELRRDYQRLKFRRGRGVAKVAIARKLAVRLYWKLREAAQPVPPAPMQGIPASPVVGESLSSF